MTTEPETRRSTKEAEAHRHNWIDFSPKYNAALWTALKVQAVLCILTALNLDMGDSHRVFWVAFLCHWVTILIILLRRPMNPTRLDLVIVCYAIIPLLLAIYALGPELQDYLGITPAP